MKKIVYITIFIVFLFIGFLGFTYSYEDHTEPLKFELIGPSVLYVDVNSSYEEYGVKVFQNGKDISSSVSIDNSSLDMHKFGEYKIKYEIDIAGIKEYIYRTVKVIDKTKPKIKLKGDNPVYIALLDTYSESGYEVIDNYDTDLSKQVKVSGGVDTSKPGEYKLEYRVADSSGNEGQAVRTVIVKKPDITLENVDGNRYVINDYNVFNYQNTITKNAWTSSGVYYEGYVKGDHSSFRIKLKNKDNSLEYLYNMQSVDGNHYKGSMDLTMLPNGEYDLYILGNGEWRLLNKLDGLTRLLRAKVSNKLVSISYDDDSVRFIIKDFNYEYDILIDPGHGGDDIGASNWSIYEKEMNLKQSLYEKCRYESMGYKVYMTRNDDSYGKMLGSDRMDRLQRRALVMGYYGAVSRVVYSNHHNASLDSFDHGFEILVSNTLKANELTLEKALYKKFREYYKIQDNAIRLYSRDYNTSIRYDKFNGEVYPYMDYYAVIRIPNELFNVKSIIFEPMYMSNYSEFNWYWNDKKWMDISEIKIEEYVHYLGGTYNKDNSMCLS